MKQLNEVYAVYILDSLLDYSETKLFSNVYDALHEFNVSVNEAKKDNRIKEIYSQSDEHLYYEGDESSVKILIEKIQIK